MKRLRAGFIGTGGIVGAHLDVLKARGDIEIAALCDMKRESAEKRQSQYGGKVYTDFNEMLENEKLDAVWLCTPPEVREKPLLACAEKGLPVLCEKPVERSEEKAKAIARKLTKLKAKVQVGYVFRSTNLTQELKKLMKDDRIHLVQSLYACGVSLSMSLPLWFYDKSKSGGALIDQATHNLDLLRCLFGEVTEVKGFASNPVKRKRKGYTIDEVISLSFKFESGALGSHIHTWVGDGWRNEILLSGEKALYRLIPGSKLVVERKDCDPLKKAKKKAGDCVYELKGAMFSYENDAFIKMVRSGDWSKNPSSYQDALKTLQLTLACDRALEE